MISILFFETWSLAHKSKVGRNDLSGAPFNRKSTAETRGANKALYVVIVCVGVWSVYFLTNKYSRTRWLQSNFYLPMYKNCVVVNVKGMSCGGYLEFLMYKKCTFCKGSSDTFYFCFHSFEEELLQNICPMLKLCPAVVAILDFQSTAFKNRQYLTQTFDPDEPRPLNCHREKKEDCNCVANTRCWKLSFARSVAFSINNRIPHQTVTDFKQWILTTFLYSKKFLFSVMVNRSWLSDKLLKAGFTNLHVSLWS